MPEIPCYHRTVCNEGKHMNGLGFEAAKLAQPPKQGALGGGGEGGDEPPEGEEEEEVEEDEGDGAEGDRDEM